MDKLLQEERLTMAQYVALSFIEASPRITNAEIARRAFVTPQTMHRIVTGIERSGLVESATDATNKREILRSLTDRGKDLVTRGHRIAKRVERELLRGFSAGEAERLAEYLRRMMENVKPAEDRD
jgi:DNA-binding MarR family transcriptional regulator